MAYIAAPDFRIRSIEWELDRPGQINSSVYTGRRSVLQNPWHAKWRAKVELAMVQGESEFRLLRSFFARCEGQINVFRIYATTEAQNANTGVTVASTAAAGATSMTISGATTPLTEGQFFTVNGQLCVCIADQSGSTLTFEPPLRAQAASGAIVVTSRPYALVSMTASSLGWSIGAARRYGAGFSVEEAIGDADGVAPEQIDLATLFSGGRAGVWYDPSDLSSMWQDSAGTTPAAVDSPVGKINDKSGNGYHATQATAAARPMLRSAAGLYWLEFDGVDDRLTTTFTANNPADRISALRSIAWVSGDYIYDSAGASSDRMALVATPSDPTYKIANPTVGPGVGLTTGTNFVATERFDGVNSRAARNNDAYATADAGTGNATGLSMGGWGSAGFYANFRLYGVFMRTGGTLLTDAEVSQVRAVMAGKAGVTL